MPNPSIKTIPRIVHYYEIILVLKPTFTLDSNKYNSSIQALFSEITKIVAKKDPSRYQHVNDKEIFINEIAFKNKSGKRIVHGKLLSIRKDFFPMLMDTSTDISRDIEALEEEGVLETTHFVIQEKNANVSNKVKICLEYNQFGARINDLLYYLEVLGKKLGIVKEVQIVPLITKSLSGYKKRIGEISRVTVRVHNNNIPLLKSVDMGLWTSFEKTAEHFQQEYLTLKLKYNVLESKHAPDSNTAKTSKTFVGRLLNHLVKKPNDADLFEELSVDAEDHDKNNRIIEFDFLVNRIKDTLKVERRYPSKTLVSVRYVSENGRFMVKPRY